VDELVATDLSESSSSSELTERLETRSRGRALSDSSGWRGSSRALLDDSRSVDDSNVLEDLEVGIISRDQVRHSGLTFRRLFRRRDRADRENRSVESRLHDESDSTQHRSGADHCLSSRRDREVEEVDRDRAEDTLLDICESVRACRAARHSYRPVEAISSIFCRGQQTYDRTIMLSLDEDPVELDLQTSSDERLDVLGTTCSVCDRLRSIPGNEPDCHSPTVV
tara:strand:+ start:1834 stop:2505 length:672 start_codon:yes stop_codon:yes gene_type:complete